MRGSTEKTLWKLEIARPADIFRLTHARRAEMIWIIIEKSQSTEDPKAHRTVPVAIGPRHTKTKTQRGAMRVLNPKTPANSPTPSLPSTLLCLISHAPHNPKHESDT